MKFLIFILLFSFSFPSLGEETTQNEMDIDLVSFCDQENFKQSLNIPKDVSKTSCLPDAQKTQSELTKLENSNQQLMNFISGTPKITPLENAQLKLDVCKNIMQLASLGTKPVALDLTDENGSPWKIRFSFGFNKTKYFNTDMHVTTDRMNVVIKDYEIAERTSADFYNPKNWDKLQSAFQWIDEPTNSFIFSFEHKKDVFTVTVFHPKFLNEKYQEKQVNGTVDGVQIDKVVQINTLPNTPNYNDPGSMQFVGFQSTHKQLDLQIGYGHKFDLLKGKAGTLSITPHVDAGVSVGKNHLTYEAKDTQWTYVQYDDLHAFQGFNASVGTRLEYQYGKVGVFVDPRFVHSHLKNTYSVGSAEYDMNYVPVTMGISFDIVTIKKKK